jgi:hypothetical protein
MSMLRGPRFDHDSQQGGPSWWGFEEEADRFKALAVWIIQGLSCICCSNMSERGQKGRQYFDGGGGWQYFERGLLFDFFLSLKAGAGSVLRRFCWQYFEGRRGMVVF